MALIKVDMRSKAKKLVTHSSNFVTRYFDSVEIVHREFPEPTQLARHALLARFRFAENKLISKITTADIQSTNFIDF